MVMVVLAVVVAIVVVRPDISCTRMYLIGVSKKFDASLRINERLWYGLGMLEGVQQSA